MNPTDIRRKHLNGSLSIFQRKFINPEGADSFKRLTTRLNISNNFKINETTSIDVTGRYISRYEDAYYIAYERYIVNMMLQKFFFNKQTCPIN